MSEGLLTDSVATEEQTAPEAPAENEFANPEFNAEDNLDEESSEGTEQPESTEDNDPNSADSKEGGLRLADYTRKTQDLADQRARLEAEYQQKLQASQAQLQEQLNQQKELIQALKPADENDLMSQALQNPDLTPADRAGLQYIQGVEQQNKELAAKVEELSNMVATIQPTLQQTHQAVTQQTQAQQEAQTKIFNEQLAEADKAFGEDKSNAAKNHIRYLWNTPNPRTGEPYTIKELVAEAHNLPAQEVEKAVAKQTNGRARAKKKVSTPSQPAQTPEPQGMQSKEETLREIEATMQ